MTLSKTALQQLKVSPGERFRVRDHDPRWLPPVFAELAKEERKPAGKEFLKARKAELTELQGKFYADSRFALLLVFQAMDAAGKDSTIKHVMSGVNPQGCEVTSFKVPSEEEKAHDFLWRHAKAMPPRGRIGIFNRSYYEDVLVVKVHPEILADLPLPPGKRGNAFWERRYDDINAFEDHLSNSGTRIVKFFLNVSLDEQRQRFLDRIDDPSKNWKFSSGDVDERKLWPAYMNAFEEAINATSTERAPWYVIPADRKWAMRAMVASIIVSTLDSMNLAYPAPDDEHLTALAAAKVALTSDSE